MASIPNGILGDFVGTAGNVCGYMRNGKNFIRSRRRKSSSPMTPKRLAQQQKIKVCNEFTKPFCGTGFFNKTFPAYGHSGTGFNRVTSALMNLATRGEYPQTTIDYSKVLISKGALPGAEKADAELNSEGDVFFSWEDNSGNGTAKENDKVILVAYCPELKQVIFSIGSAHRRDENATLNMGALKGNTIETWIGFLNADENNASCSDYCGELIS